jgi:RHS repeat-associated protein
MAMKGRQLNPVYRFGYNGMEVDNEVSGNGNSYSTEFRQYDPRLGRWKSLDPLMAQFPWQSPYCAFDNNPVFYNDPLGLAAEGGDEDSPRKSKKERTYRNPEKAAERYRKKNGGEHKITEKGTHYIERGEGYGVSAKVFRQKESPFKRLLKNVKQGFLDFVKKADNLFKYGLNIYGDAHSSNDSPGRKIKGNDNDGGSIDFGEFSDYMSIYILGKSSKSEMSLDGKFDGTKLAEKTNDLKEIVETFKENKNSSDAKFSKAEKNNTSQLESKKSGEILTVGFMHQINSMGSMDTYYKDINELRKYFPNTKWSEEYKQYVIPYLDYKNGPSIR